jgi:hypothetical protein
MDLITTKQNKTNYPPSKFIERWWDSMLCKTLSGYTRGNQRKSLLFTSFPGVKRRPSKYFRSGNS